ncbi:MAG: carboxypeptidase-like regulatory domain-containing protein [Gemmataceae bacterium]|nr:carboxypeptidase-like regulatory domain-containing protein [Gemmataceae bacterium]
MKPLMVGVVALGLWASSAPEAAAAWDNCFQPTLFGHFRRNQSNYTPPVVVHSSPVFAQAAPHVAMSPDPCNPCPQVQCTTSYVQRCYYQPVTTYQTQTVYEQVTTYRTNYYYEPVTSYRYSCYYDPCTCSYKQVATPVVSQVLRAQSCPVQTWVARCVQVPVQSCQKVCYYQPQTTCCQTTNGAPVWTLPAGAAGPPNITTTPGAGGPPNITTDKSPSAPGGPPIFDKQYYYPEQKKNEPPTITPSTTPNMGWQPSKAPGVPTIAPPTPPVKLDRIVVGPDSTVQGQVVRSDNAPRPGAKIIFVSAQNQAARQDVTANTAGRFHVSLASGSYNVYLHGADGIPFYHSQLNVGQLQTASITLVNR